MAFSLKQYDQTVNLLLPTVDDPECGPVADDVILIASRVSEGVVPPFAIDAADQCRAAETTGAGPERRMPDSKGLPVLTVDECLALADLLRLKDDPFFGQPGVQAAAGFLGATGEWGLALARQSLQAPQVPLPAKLGALSTLSAAGTIHAGDAVTLVGRDRTWRMTLGSLVPSDEDPAVRLLLYVGRATVDGKRHLVAVIPAELREPLDAVLATADRVRKKRQHK